MLHLRLINNCWYLLTNDNIVYHSSRSLYSAIGWSINNNHTII